MSEDMLDAVDRWLSTGYGGILVPAEALPPYGMSDLVDANCIASMFKWLLAKAVVVTVYQENREGAMTLTLNGAGLPASWQHTRVRGRSLLMALGLACQQVHHITFKESDG